MYHGRQTEKQIVRKIRLSPSDLAAVEHLLNQLLHQRSYDLVSARDSTTPECLLKLARNMLKVRRLRLDLFKKPMFGEPAWDMLLTLYVNSAHGTRQSVGRLSATSGSPSTTALRWLDYLEREQLVRREPNPTDRRSDFVELTPKGICALEQYLTASFHCLA